MTKGRLAIIHLLLYLKVQFLRIQNYVLSLKPNQDDSKRLMIRETNRVMFDEVMKEISRVESIAGYGD